MSSFNAALLLFVCISCCSTGFAVTISPAKVAEQLCYGCQIGCCSSVSSPWLHGGPAYLSRDVQWTLSHLAERLSSQMPALQDGEQCGKTSPSFHTWEEGMFSYGPTAPWPFSFLSTWLQQVSHDHQSAGNVYPRRTEPACWPLLLSKALTGVVTSLPWYNPPGRGGYRLWGHMSLLPLAVIAAFALLRQPEEGFGSLKTVPSCWMVDCCMPTSTQGE